MPKTITDIIPPSRRRAMLARYQRRARLSAWLREHAAPILRRMAANHVAHMQLGQLVVGEIQAGKAGVLNIGDQLLRIR